jgi:DNA topoisomerase-1
MPGLVIKLRAKRLRIGHFGTSHALLFSHRDNTRSGAVAGKRASWSQAERLSQQLAQAVGLESPQVAAAARLTYVSDQVPGIYRRRHGSHFRYVDSQGRSVRDAATLERIRSIAIPPAWTDVWICPSDSGHLQATGRDARGRKQYRYHARWRELRDQSKYARLSLFGAALPRIRRQVARDLKLPGMPRRKVLALLVRLLETTLIRVGNEEYARSNGSFGLTTFRDQHAHINGYTVRFRFRGKSGKLHEVGLADRRLAALVKRCQDMPGHELFQYIDEQGEVCAVGSADVNDYLREASGDDFTAKDFRTWAGTLLAATTLAKGGPRAARGGRKAVVRAIQAVSERLGNTVAVCRKCYIHPAIFERYSDGRLASELACLASGEARMAETALRKFLAAETARSLQSPREFDQPQRKNRRRQTHSNDENRMSQA